MNPSTSHPRIASLLPAATEMVAALGLADRLVGRSHECDYPPGLEHVPVLTRPRIGGSGSSADIDRELRGQALSALGVFELTRAALEVARPDVILTQDLCEVCAVPFAAVEEAVQSILGSSTRILRLSPTRFEQLFDDLVRLGQELGASLRARELVTSLRARVEFITARAKQSARRPRVLTIEWLEPTMIGGTWMPELVELAGGRALVTKAGEPARTLTHEALRRLRPAPDIVLLKPCGMTLERGLAEWSTIGRVLTNLDWPALWDGELYLADGSSYFNRPGPRLVDSLEILASIVQPGVFPQFAERYALWFTRLAWRPARSHAASRRAMEPS